MQPYGYDRPPTPLLFLQTPSQRPLSFLHFCAVSPPLLLRNRSAFGLTALLNQSLTVALATSTPLMISAILLSSRTKAVIVNATRLKFKTCNGNVEDVRALQGNGVTTLPRTYSLDYAVSYCWLVAKSL